MRKTTTKCGKPAVCPPACSSVRVSKMVSNALAVVSRARKRVLLARCLCVCVCVFVASVCYSSNKTICWIGKFNPDALAARERKKMQGKRQQQQQLWRQLGSGKTNNENDAAAWSTAQYRYLVL